jgi:anthranilate synthase component 1
VGYFSYDTVRHIEQLPDAPPRGVPVPDACFLLTGTVVILDNLLVAGAGGRERGRA